MKNIFNNDFLKPIALALFVIASLFFSLFFSLSGQQSKAPSGHTEQASWFINSKTVLEVREDDHGSYWPQFDSSVYPLSAIGLLIVNKELQCTGFIVGPYEVITAAHCIYDIKNIGGTHGKDPYDDIIIVFERFENNHSGNKKYRLRPVLTHSAHTAQVDRQRRPRRAPAGFLHDWYLLKSDKPIGEYFGWLGLKNSQQGTTSSSQRVPEYFSREMMKYFITSGNSLNHIFQLRSQTPVKEDVIQGPNELALTKTIVPSFISANGIGKHTVDRGNFSTFPMSISYDCNFKDFLYKDLLFTNLIHNCNISGGASGSPHLEISDNKAYVTGIISGGSGNIKQSAKKTITERIIKHLQELYSILKKHNPEEDSAYQYSFDKKTGKRVAQLKRMLKRKGIFINKKSSDIGNVFEHLQTQRRRFNTISKERLPFFFTQAKTHPMERNYNQSTPSDDFFYPVRDYLKENYPHLF